MKKQIKLMSGKIHRASVTDAQLNYIGSITIDNDLLERSGILPLEEVYVVNLTNGTRWQTYALPGPSGSGMICPNGGCAHFCKKGDLLIIWSNIFCDRDELTTTGHLAKTLIMNEDNSIREVLNQTLSFKNGEAIFDPRSQALIDGSTQPELF